MCHGLEKYLDYLKKQNSVMATHHKQLMPARSPFKDATVETVMPSGNGKNIPIKFTDLYQHLKQKNFYEPVDLTEFIGEYESRDARYLFIKDLSKNGLGDISFELLRYSPGGSVRTLAAVWKIPNEGFNRKRSDEVAGALREAMPIFHTRAMKAEFKSRFENIAKLTPAVHRAVYRFLTGDESLPDNRVTKEVDARMMIALDSGDPELVVDLRQLNKGRPEKYNEFWSKLGNYLEEHVAAQERRHGNIGYMPVACSVPDLIGEIKGRLPDGTPIPSETWVRYQFWPKDPSSKTATQYTGRFNVRFQVQTRQLRHDHPDSHYCAAQLKYLKEFVVKFRSNVCLVMEDDKHYINVGEPGLPLASLGRGRRVMVTGPAESRPTALDHDFCRLHVTLSVTLVPTIPEVSSESFYQGQVYVAVKDSIFQSSSALRHAAESSPVVEESGAPILASVADGGPDHNVRHGQTQLALISSFQRHNLDMLVAINTCPGNSWANPPERIMSILNIALYGVSLARDEMDSRNEKLLRRCSNMKEIREKADGDGELKAAIQASLKNVTGLIQDRFGKLSLKGQKFKILEAVSDEDLRRQFAFVHDIDPTLQLGIGQKSELLKKDDLQAWSKKHLRTRQYSFQIKKCDQAPPSEVHKEQALGRNSF